MSSYSDAVRVLEPLRQEIATEEVASMIESAKPRVYVSREVADARFVAGMEKVLAYAIHIKALRLRLSRKKITVIAMPDEPDYEVVLAAHNAAVAQKQAAAIAAHKQEGGR